MTLQQSLIVLQTELDGLNKIQSRLLIKSPVDGRIKNFATLSINQWVSNLDELMGIVKYGTGSVVGFVKEGQIDRFKIKEHAVFIPFDGQHSKVKLISQDLDLSSISVLPYPAYLQITVDLLQQEHLYLVNMKIDLKRHTIRQLLNYLIKILQLNGNFLGMFM